MAKQLPCCARRTGKLTHDQNNLATLARKAAYYASRGQTIEKYRTRIAEVKSIIELDKQSIIDHEAEHADGTALVSA